MVLAEADDSLPEGARHVTNVFRFMGRCDRMPACRVSRLLVPERRHGFKPYPSWTHARLSLERGQMSLKVSRRQLLSAAGGISLGSAAIRNAWPAIVTPLDLTVKKIEHT